MSSPSLYGGTYNLFHYTLPKLGITTTFVENPDDPESWRAAVRPNTKLFFGESISNPKNDILDIEAVAAVAHEVGVPLIIDNTVATPYLIRPFEWGADIVVHSATKYLGGHGTSVAGVIVDAGTFDYAQYPERFPNYNQPDPSYHGLVYARDLGVGSAFGANLSFILKARVQLLRDLGAAVSPFNAFLIAQGLETLSPAHRAARRERQGRGGVAGGPRRGRVRQLRGPAVEPLVRARPEVRAARHRRRPQLRDQGRRGRRPGLRRGAGAAQPRGQHRRRAQPGHPPGVDDALAADARGAGWRRASRLASFASPSGIENIDDILADLDSGFRAAKQA